MWGHVAHRCPLGIGGGVSRRGCVGAVVCVRRGVQCGVMLPIGVHLVHHVWRCATAVGSCSCDLWCEACLFVVVVVMVVRVRVRVVRLVLWGLGLWGAVVVGCRCSGVWPRCADWNF